LKVCLAIGSSFEAGLSMEATYQVTSPFNPSSQAVQVVRKCFYIWRTIAYRMRRSTLYATHGIEMLEDRPLRCLQLRGSCVLSMRNFDMLAVLMFAATRSLRCAHLWPTWLGHMCTPHSLSERRCCFSFDFVMHWLDFVSWEQIEH
jgi:hypothetical protein